MIQPNTNEMENSKYLYIEGAIKRVGDEELVHEMLTMLNSSIENDWLEFEKYLNTNQYAQAANILHGMKGTIPIFSDKKTEEVMQKADALLRVVDNELALKKTMKELSVHVQGFIADLKQWAIKQN
jgi:HPt (histidine-containing phosphotransfer) domain-containing protein